MELKTLQEKALAAENQKLTEKVQYYKRIYPKGLKLGFHICFF